MSFNEDLSEFFDPDDFGVTATYSNANYASVHPSTKSTSVSGIFRNGYAEINGMETLTPLFLCAANTVSDVTNGAKLTINSVNYTVRGVQPDGTGLVRLVLENV